MVDFSSEPAPDAPLRAVRPERQASAAFSPLYRQIKALIVQALDAGEWRPGEAIPSEMELAARFAVSQGTVRKAIDELAAQHLLIRRQGKGTFVATHHEARVRYRFLRLAADHEESSDTDRAESRFIACRREPASGGIARALALAPGDPVVAIRRLLTLGGAATVIDDIWLTGTLFNGLTAELLADYRGPLYALFESEFGVSMVRADEKLRAVAASGDAAALLGVAAGSPLLQVERVSYTYADRPVEVRRGLYLTGRYHYRNQLL